MTTYDTEELKHQIGSLLDASCIVCNCRSNVEVTIPYHIISYHIIPYQIKSYHIIPYHIIHIIYHIYSRSLPSSTRSRTSAPENPTLTPPKKIFLLSSSPFFYIFILPFYSLFVSIHFVPVPHAHPPSHVILSVRDKPVEAHADTASAPEILLNFC